MFKFKNSEVSIDTVDKISKNEFITTISADNISIEDFREDVQLYIEELSKKHYITMFESFFTVKIIHIIKPNK